MKKEIIELQEHEIAAILCWDYVKYNDEYYDEEDELINGVWNNFKWITNISKPLPLKIGPQEINIIVKRPSDGRFFSGFYTLDCGCIKFNNLFLTEVFPVEKTIISYE
jgi:hypothetical protein